MTGIDRATEGLSESERALLLSALYDNETASGWYGQPECAEVAHLMAPAVERILAARAAQPAPLREKLAALADEWSALDMGIGLYPEDSAHREAHEARAEACADRLRALLADGAAQPDPLRAGLKALVAEWTLQGATTVPISGVRSLLADGDQ